MAKVKVTYFVAMTQTIDWPDDEMDSFTHDNLVCNCEPENSQTAPHSTELVRVTVDGKKHEF